jgi:hypothetical protein
VGIILTSLAEFSQKIMMSQSACESTNLSPFTHVKVYVSGDSSPTDHLDVKNGNTLRIMGCRFDIFSVCGAHIRKSGEITYSEFKQTTQAVLLYAGSSCFGLEVGWDVLLDGERRK